MVKFFPTLLILLDVAAALVYLWCGDWKHCIYWLAAGTLTYSVTWM